MTKKRLTISWFWWTWVQSFRLYGRYCEHSCQRSIHLSKSFVSNCLRLTGSGHKWFSGGKYFKSIYQSSYDIIAKGLIQLGIISEASEARNIIRMVSATLGWMFMTWKLSGFGGRYGHYNRTWYLHSGKQLLWPKMVEYWYPYRRWCLDHQWWPGQLVGWSTSGLKDIEELMKEESALKDFILPEINSLVSK